MPPTQTLPTDTMTEFAGEDRAFPVSAPDPTSGSAEALARFVAQAELSDMPAHAVSRLGDFVLDFTGGVDITAGGKTYSAVPGTGSICLAAASRVEDSVVYRASAKRDPGNFLIGNPSGIVAAEVISHYVTDSPYVAFDTLGFSRTARRLMDGNAYYPSDLLDTATRPGL